MLTYLSKSSALDLDRNTERKLLNSNTGPSRLVREVLRILSIHLCEISHIRKEDLESISSQDPSNQNLNPVK